MKQTIEWIPGDPVRCGYFYAGKVMKPDHRHTHKYIQIDIAYYDTKGGWYSYYDEGGNLHRAPKAISEGYTHYAELGGADE